MSTNLIDFNNNHIQQIWHYAWSFICSVQHALKPITSCGLLCKLTSQTTYNSPALSDETKMTHSVTEITKSSTVCLKNYFSTSNSILLQFSGAGYGHACEPQLPNDGSKLKLMLKFIHKYVKQNPVNFIILPTYFWRLKVEHNSWFTACCSETKCFLVPRAQKGKFKLKNSYIYIYTQRNFYRLSYALSICT